MWREQEKVVIFPWTRDGSPLVLRWQPGADRNIKMSFIRSALRLLRPFDSHDGLAEWPRTKRDLHGQRRQPQWKAEQVGSQDGRDGEPESLRRSRTISRGGSSWESRAPPRTPHADPLASPPCPPQQFELVARHGSGDATAPRPFETHPTIISWTSSRLLSRSRRHALSPSLFSCDISDSVNPPPSSASTDSPSIFPHLAKKKKKHVTSRLVSNRKLKKTTPHLQNPSAPPPFPACPGPSLEVWRLLRRSSLVAPLPDQLIGRFQAPALAPVV